MCDYYVIIKGEKATQIYLLPKPNNWLCPGPEVAKQAQTIYQYFRIYSNRHQIKTD